MRALVKRRELRETRQCECDIFRQASFNPEVVDARPPCLARSLMYASLLPFASALHFPPFALGFSRSLLCSSWWTAFKHDNNTNTNITVRTSPRMPACCEPRAMQLGCSSASCVNNINPVILVTIVVVGTVAAKDTDDAQA